MRWRLSLALVAALAAQAAQAEVSAVSLHVQPGVLFDLKYGGVMAGGAIKLDTTALGLGPVALQAQFYGMSGDVAAHLAAGQLFGGGLGVRVRLLNDETGYAFGTKGVSGSAMSNLFAEAHLDYSHGGFGLGADVGVGLELSLLEGILLAPSAKVFFTSFSDKFEPVLMLGVEVSFGLPFNPGAETDGDGDGFKASTDKCPAEAEDKDGFEDDDGCPDEDNDKDEILDEKDACPNLAEDKNGKQDDDGCPETDDDGDGVSNDKDKCRTEKEDKDGFEDQDGCPDPDNDKDGVPDVADKCPAAAEDKDTFQDDDGCPDLDDDNDGVPDSKDKCPSVAETKNGVDDDDGCPEDLDKDKDGLNDDKDKCPAEAETVNGVDDEDGCPEKDVKAHVTGGKLVLAEQVVFGAGNDKVQAKSAKLLDAVAEVLKKLPGLKKVRVEGHTNEGGDDAKAQALSEKRAQAVVKELVARKVEAARLEAKGLGNTAPLAVELVVVEGAAK